MRGSRAKKLRRELDVRHPGRKHGGVSPWERTRTPVEPMGFDHADQRRSLKRRPADYGREMFDKMLRRVRGVGR